MSQSQDMCQCHKCKGTMMILDDLDTYETTQWCLRCGYYFDHSLEMNEKWEYVRNKDGSVKYKDTEFAGGYGRFSLLNLTNEEGIEERLDQPLSSEQIEEYRRRFEDKNVDKKRSHLIVLVDAKFELLFGEVNDMVLMDYEAFWDKYEYVGKDE